MTKDELRKAQEIVSETSGQVIRGRTPAGTRVRFLVDVIDVNDDTGTRYTAARAGETGTVLAQAKGFSDWPTVVMDEPTGDDHRRVVVADMENPREVEII